LRLELRARLHLGHQVLLEHQLGVHLRDEATIFGHNIGALASRVCLMEEHLGDLRRTSSIYTNTANIRSQGP
jgi:hypothetical protein